MLLNTNVITKPATFKPQQELLFGVNALWEERRKIGAPCVQRTVLPGSTINVPTEENAAMIIRRSCISVRALRAGREGGVKPFHQMWVFVEVNYLVTKKCMNTNTNRRERNWMLHIRCRSKWVTNQLRLSYDYSPLMLVLGISAYSLVNKKHKSTGDLVRLFIVSRID